METNKINCILLIDDDNITNYINQRLLKKLNLTENIVTTNNGDEALKFIDEYCKANNSCCPELIFMDVNMPGMKGFDFLEEFNKLDIANRNNIRIVVVSASSHEADKGKTEGMDLPYLTKPLTIESIKGVLEKV